MQFLKRLLPRPQSQGIRRFERDIVADSQEAVIDWLVHGCNVKSDAWGVAGKWRAVVLGGKSGDTDIGVYAEPGPDQERLIANLLATTACAQAIDLPRTHWDIVLHGGEKVDLIIHPRQIQAQDMLDAAHVGISAIATNLFTGETWIDDDFNIDRARGEIRLRRFLSPSQAGKTVAKLQAKYPKFGVNYNNKALI